MAQQTFYNTAVQEAIETDSNLPSYVVAADTLNIGNRNRTFFEAASDIIEDVPKFIGASIISGANQLYNIPADIGNLLGGDFERSDTSDVITDFDSDLGKFYEENQEGVDLVGFIASSLIPGTGGIKLLNVGQRSLQAAIGRGVFGTNTGKALGLLAPNKQDKLKLAINEVINSNSTVSLTNREALRAINAGFTQNVLEGAAFEVAVAATLFDSPILEAQTMGDLIANIAFGAGVFGLIGGVVDATKINSALKKAANLADEESAPWRFIPEQADASKSYERITLDFESIANMPPIPKEFGQDKITFLEGLAASTIEKLEGRIRKEFAVLANGDQVMAGTLFETFKRTSLENQQGAFIGVTEIARATGRTKIEARLDKLTDLAKSNKATDDELNELASTARSWAKIWGEGIGRVILDEPVLTNIIDTLQAGEKLLVTSKGVTIVTGKNTAVAGSKRWDFNTSYNERVVGKINTTQPWTVLASDPLEANARYMWASKLKPFKPSASKQIFVHENDIPLLEKLIKETPDNKMSFVNIVLEDTTKIGGVDRTLTRLNEMNGFEFLVKKKAQLANRLHTATSEGLIGSNADTVAAKLRSLLGINFVVRDLKAGKKARLITMQGGSKTEGFQRIEVDRVTLTTRPLHELVSTILHEEGHLKFNTLLDIGGIPKNEYAAIKQEIIAASKQRRPEAWENITEGSEFWQYLNSNHELMADTFAFFTQNPGRVAIEAPTFNRLFGHLIRPLPKELIDSYAVRAKQLTQDEIASIINVKSKWLGGEQIKGDVGSAVERDVLAMQDHQREYSKLLREQDSLAENAPDIDIWNVPQHVKLTHDTSTFKDINGHVLENMVIIKQQQQAYQAATALASKQVLGDSIWDQLQDITSGMIFGQANRSGAGGSLFGAASNNYGRLAALTEFNGSVTARAIETFKARARETLDPLAYNLAQKPAAAIEWSVMEARVRNLEDIYGLNAAGDALEPIKLLRWKEQAEIAAAAGKKVPKAPVLLNPETPARIELQHQEVRNMVRGHIEVNGARTESLNSIRSAQGVKYQRDPGSFYPVPVDPKDFPHFALVTDESVTSVGHHTTLFATSDEQLAVAIDKIKNQNPHWKVRTKKEAEEYFENIGQWSYEKTLSDNYLDVAKHRSGASAPFIPATDPDKIVNRIMNWHMQRETGLVREAVSAKYEVQFKELERLGDQFTNVRTSTFTNRIRAKFSADAVENPFGDYIKTSLAVKKTEQYPFWVWVNQVADEAVSKLLNRVSGAVQSAKTEQELLAVNKMLEQAGYKGAHYDESMELFANATPDRGLLTRAVQKTNSILATIVLRLDTLNAVNNAVSANVLLGAETQAVIRAISRGDEEAVGALAKLTRIKVPGTDKTIFSPTKLIANSIRKFNRSEADMQFYKDIGVVTTISQQYRSTLEALSYTGKDVAGWNARIDGVQQGLVKLANTGERWTGNKLAEEFNRFVAADVMKQMTDVAIVRGLMTKKEQMAYINTFVNRTQGNYLAAQRPMMFQGPIGQAIGLFQTYQFNLMQQLLRHVGEGQAKDTMTLLALQGTIHGMNGLPGFNAINTHVIGTASGNKEHRDAYDAVYGIAGKEAGDWITYGLASNALGLIDPDLKLNLYTRGDINPRHVTILPTDPSQVPIIQASAKFFANLFKTAQKLEAGGDVVGTLLQGLEHNGLSRPLAGLAQTLEGLANPLKQSYSTSKRGNVIAANDLLSLANLTRLIGGKPLDEAIAIDATFRFKAYGLVDAKRRNILGQAIKTRMIAGEDPTQEQIEDFAVQYAAAGGRQKEFNKWFTQLYRTANLSQANKISQSLSSPFTQSMQRIMGGRELRDFTNSGQ